MSKDNESRILTKVARMYYIDEMNQSQIAKKLGVHRTTISRMLKKAREEEIVKIEIENDYNEYIELERKLEENFNLKEVCVVPSSSKQTEEVKKRNLGLAGVDLLKRIIKDGNIMGFAWGTTLAALAEELLAHKEECKSADLTIIPLVGGPGDMNNKYDVNTIISKVATTFNATERHLYVPAITSEKSTKEALIKDANIREVLEFWDKVDIAVVGIGTPIKSSNMIWTGYFGNEDIEYLTEKNAVGDICSRYYDIDGNIIDSYISDRTIAIELEKLQDINYSIAVAESVDKVPSILGALRGGFINVLITNEITARKLINYKL
jgi:DNA-binding transcriptional regulator LsrR (DeoR family)